MAQGSQSSAVPCPWREQLGWLLKNKCCSDLQKRPQHLGFASLLEPIHPQDMKQLRWFLP